MLHANIGLSYDSSIVQMVLTFERSSKLRYSLHRTFKHFRNCRWSSETCGNDSGAGRDRKHAGYNALIPDQSRFQSHWEHSFSTAHRILRNDNHARLRTRSQAGVEIFFRSGSEFSKEFNSIFYRTITGILAIFDPDLKHVLHLSLLFFEAQRSGKLPMDNRRVFALKIIPYSLTIYDLKSNLALS